MKQEDLVVIDELSKAYQRIACSSGREGVPEKDEVVLASLLDQILYLTKTGNTPVFNNYTLITVSQRGYEDLLRSNLGVTYSEGKLHFEYGDKLKLKRTLTVGNVIFVDDGTDFGSSDTPPKCSISR